MQDFNLQLYYKLRNEFYNNLIKNKIIKDTDKNYIYFDDNLYNLFFDYFNEDIKQKLK